MASPRPFSIVPARTMLPDGVGPLAAEAEREGVRIVATVVERWRDGSERFDRPGEALLVAVADGEVVAIGGLSECPDVAGALRMRRFYVAPAWRRRGVGRAIADELLGGERARAVTITCNARASAAAPPFWESLGFVPVDRVGITHIRRHRAGRSPSVPMPSS